MPGIPPFPLQPVFIPSYLPTLLPSCPTAPLPLYSTAPPHVCPGCEDNKQHLQPSSPSLRSPHSLPALGLPQAAVPSSVSTTVSPKRFLVAPQSLLTHTNESWTGFSKKKEKYGRDRLSKGYWKGSSQYTGYFSPTPHASRFSTAEGGLTIVIFLNVMLMYIVASVPFRAAPLPCHSPLPAGH
ncbi:hypothetical protein E2C01_031034 [Portunus trituberculatus]|uniref:Uncharacterized protein n=1 Tax=Portunus trituberculatus TaxID=210409 RepID=A0A5B7EX04_PORTR|nr:hypothetical protein [Portunus trituberculatus]